MSMRAIIVLAGGQSSRLGYDKAFVSLDGNPLVSRVVEKLRPLGDEFFVSIGRDHEIDNYRRVLPADTTLVQDNVDFHGPLAGFVTALTECRSKECFLVACDMPFVDPKVVEFLFQRAEMSGSVVPRWNDGRLEPLHAVYERDVARRAATQAINEQTKSMIGLVEHIPHVQFVSVETEIKSIDPSLQTFRNFNTPRDFGSLDRGYAN